MGHMCEPSVLIGHMLNRHNSESTLAFVGGQVDKQILDETDSGWITTHGEHMTSLHIGGHGDMVSTMVTW